MPSPSPPRDVILARAIAPLLETALRTMRVVVVTGPRQAGKSTLVRTHPRLQSRPYYSLDDSATLLRAQADRRAFVRSGPDMIIDEVNATPSSSSPSKLSLTSSARNAADNSCSQAPPTS